MAREMKSQKGGGTGETGALKKCLPPELAKRTGGDSISGPPGCWEGGGRQPSAFSGEKASARPGSPLYGHTDSGGNTPCAQPARREPPIFGPNMSGEGAGRVDTERGDHKIAGDRVESGRGHGGSSESIWGRTGHFSWDPLSGAGAMSPPTPTLARKVPREGRRERPQPPSCKKIGGKCAETREQHGGRSECPVTQGGGTKKYQVNLTC